VIARERPGASEIEANASNPRASRRPTRQKEMGSAMEKVPGIGERDPKALARWYREHLGVTPVAGNYYDERGWKQQARPTGFAPFP